MRFRFMKSKVYAWVRWDGTLVSAPSQHIELLQDLRNSMQKKADEIGTIIRLVEFTVKETKEILFPPPDPDEEFIHCGSAIGGGGPIKDIDGCLKDLQRIFDKQYKATDVKFWIEGNKACAEWGNVRCWIAETDNPAMDVESNSRKKWSGYVTMLSGWNDEYHDFHVGDFCHGCEAVEETFLAFIKFQLSEQTIDDFF